jgi:transposase-like protein
VGLRGLLSNPATIRSIEQLTRLLDDALDQQGDAPVPPATEPPRPPYRLRDRLSGDAIAELVSAYDAGATADDLARTYRIGKVGVLQLLHKHTIVRTRPPSRLTPEQVAEAAALYDGGLSIADVGQRLGIPSSTLYRGFRVHGVATRRRGENPPRRA